MWYRANKWNEKSTGICNSNGKIILPLVEHLLDPLHSLFINNHPESQNLLTKIRKYNGCFQMTSFGVTIVTMVILCQLSKFKVKFTI